MGELLAHAESFNRLKLLHHLVDSPTPKSSKELAQAVGADPLLLLRLLRFLVATGMIGEADVDRYEATNITRNLTIPALEAGINHTYDIVGRSTMALPDFLQKTGYQNPSDPKHCPFQDAYHTEDNLFEWFPKHPEDLDFFNLWMTGQREGRANWLDFFPLKDKLLDGFKGGDNAVMFIDVGGARGHEVEAIKTKFPDVPGKFVLQDLPDTIKQALPVPEMQAVAHDFFTEQPIKGWSSRWPQDPSPALSPRAPRLLLFAPTDILQAPSATTSATSYTIGPMTPATRSSPNSWLP